MTIPAHQERNIVRLTPDPNRIQAAICHIIQRASEKNFQALTQYVIVKTLFLADRQHLNEWGRPITYDNYVAMNHGPVPSLSYSLLKENAYDLRRLDIDVPWQRVPAGNGKFHYVGCCSGALADHLSESDVEALDVAFDMVRKSSFSQIRRLTHEDPAYIDAWQDLPEKKAFEMDLALLFEEPNNELAQYLADVSEHVQAG